MNIADSYFNADVYGEHEPVIHAGELVCRNCGLVLDQIRDLDYSTDDFDPYAQTSRHTNVLHEAGTTFRYNEAGSGKRIALFRRLHTVSKWTGDYTKSERDRFNLVMRTCQVLQIPDIHVRAIVKLAESVWVSSNAASVGGATFIYLRRLGIPRSLEQVAKAVESDTLALANWIRTWHRVHPAEGTAGIDPVKYIPEIAGKLHLGQETRNLAAQYIRKHGNGRGYNPRGLVGAALYLAGRRSGERRTQFQVARVCGVSEPTIRNRYKEILKQEGRR